jgi:hypothetical protein
MTNDTTPRRATDREASQHAADVRWHSALTLGATKDGEKLAALRDALGRQRHQRRGFAPRPQK